MAVFASRKKLVGRQPRHLERGIEAYRCITACLKLTRFWRSSTSTNALLGIELYTWIRLGLNGRQLGKEGSCADGNRARWKPCCSQVDNNATSQRASPVRMSPRGNTTVRFMQYPKVERLQSSRIGGNARRISMDTLGAAIRDLMIN